MSGFLHTYPVQFIFLTPNLLDRVEASPSFPVFKHYDYVAEAMGEC